MGYPKEIYDKAWAVLDERRQSSRQNVERNQDQIRKEIPEIAQIQSEMVDTASRITRSVITAPDKAKELIDQLAERSLELQNRRSQLLRDAGLPKDYLEEKFVCNKCSDSGYVGIKRCSCFNELLRQQAFSELNHVAEGQSSTFDDFDLEYYSDKPDKNGIVPRQRMKDVLEFSQSYAENFSKDSQSLLMMGKTGLGKTHISLAIAWEIISRGFGVVYTPIQRLMDKLEAQKFSYSPESKEAYAQSMNSVLECDLLVLDDLGTEFITSFTTSVLYNIVNSRLVEGRPTIINTNLEPVEVEQTYSQRMASRLAFGYKVLRFYGEDIRFVKRQSRFQHK